MARCCDKLTRHITKERCEADESNIQYSVEAAAAICFLSKKMAEQAECRLALYQSMASRVHGANLVSFYYIAYLFLYELQYGTKT